ncbi:MAG: galactose-1-phosphate uridylyltransferase [Actinobacteria bacterium]|nr:galactose-1-phosphate uridylyltransferase [Actinomycetota bacterium]
MPEYRKDIILDEWVIIATDRAKRPENFREEKVRVQVPKTEVCPFDKGNESMTPPEILRMDSSGNMVDKSKDWLMRVVPNKFPALIPYTSPTSSRYGVYMIMDGFGLHEVVIHSPEHITNISKLSEFELGILIDVYVRRIKGIKNDKRIESVVIMLNQGREAGASLEHSHSQIFALPMSPPVLEKEIYGTKRYFKKNLRCAMCDLLEFEVKEDKRVVFKNRDFFVIQPFASRNPFETWIVPKRHSPNFENALSDEKESFAHCLKLVLDFFYYELNDPHYNYYIHTGPLQYEAAGHFHWHFELIPKLSIKAGFEIATGIDICITTPEYTAEFMKASRIFNS